MYYMKQTFRLCGNLLAEMILDVEARRISKHRTVMLETKSVRALVGTNSWQVQFQQAFQRRSSTHVARPPRPFVASLILSRRFLKTVGPCQGLRSKYTLGVRYLAATLLYTAGDESRWGEKRGRVRERKGEIVLDVDPRGSTVAPIRASGNACRKAWGSRW